MLWKIERYHTIFELLNEILKSVFDSSTRKYINTLKTGIIGMIFSENICSYFVQNIEFLLFLL
jgi:hypothetical protein